MACADAPLTAPDGAQAVSGFRPPVVLLLAASLCACGGGGGAAATNAGSQSSVQGPVAVPPAPAPNRAPTISGTPAVTAQVGVAYAFQPSASDPDGQQLTYSISGKPAWATFDVAAGTLAGTPGAGTAGLYQDIVISVSDGAATASLPAFTITVQGAAVVVPANRAPVISGVPAARVPAREAYAFQPAAVDADGDALTFSIANRPRWAAFDPNTGRLTGTPTSADIGTYANVTIGVTDGTTTSLLAPFVITVVAGPPTSVTLSWQAPTARTDGTALTNLAGYRIAYGTSSGRYTKHIDLDNPGVTTSVIPELTAGTYYFAVKAYDSDRAESNYSAEATKTIE